MRRDAPLHHVAIAADGVDAVVEDDVLRPIEALREPAPGQSHAHAVAASLTEGSVGNTRDGLGTGRRAGDHVAAADTRQVANFALSRLPDPRCNVHAARSYGLRFGVLRGDRIARRCYLPGRNGRDLD